MSSNKFPTENISGSGSGSDLRSSLSLNPIVEESNQTYLSQLRLADNPIARELNRRYLCELRLHESHDPFERERYFRKHTQLVLDVILLGMVPGVTDLFAFSLAELFEEILGAAEKEKFQKYMVELAVKCSKDVFILSSGEDCPICLQELEEGDVARGLGCYHTYHSHCILEWAKNKPNCPCCRSPITSKKRKRTD